MRHEQWTKRTKTKEHFFSFPMSAAVFCAPVLAKNQLLRMTLPVPFAVSQKSDRTSDLKSVETTANTIEPDYMPYTCAA